MELDYLREKELWTIRKISETLRRTGKAPITVRRVEVSKGDKLCPKIKSRLVARKSDSRGRKRSSHRPHTWSPSGGY